MAEDRPQDSEEVRFLCPLACAWRRLPPGCVRAACLPSAHRRVVCWDRTSLLCWSCAALHLCLDVHRPRLKRKRTCTESSQSSHALRQNVPSPAPPISALIRYRFASKDCPPLASSGCIYGGSGSGRSLHGVGLASRLSGAVPSGLSWRNGPSLLQSAEAICETPSVRFPRLRAPSNDFFQSTFLD